MHASLRICLLLYFPTCVHNTVDATGGLGLIQAGSNSAELLSNIQFLWQDLWFVLSGMAAAAGLVVDIEWYSLSCIRLMKVKLHLSHGGIAMLL